MRMPGSLAILPFLSALSAAQVPIPAELGRYDVMLGGWEGSGTVRMAAKDEPLPWTATATARKVLGGHCITQDLRVDLGGETPLAFHTIYAYDSLEKGHRFFAFDNKGTCGAGKMFWTSDGAFTGSTSHRENGVCVVERWISRFAQDSFTLRVDRSADGGAFFVHAEGTFRRSARTIAARDTGKLAMAPAHERMTILSSHLGRWRLTGSVSPVPGMPMMKSTGTQSTTAILGGHVHMGVIEEDPDAAKPQRYEGRVYTAWDPEHNSYLSVSVDNFGGLEHMRAHLVGENKLAFFSTPAMYGIAGAHRTLVQWDEKTASMTITTDRCAADRPPDKSFQGEMKRADERDAEEARKR